MEDWLTRRLVAMLLAYPLLTVALCVDVAWAWAWSGMGWWLPALYTVAVVAIASALVGYSRQVRELPATALLAGLAVSFTTATTAATLTIREILGGASGGTAIAITCAAFSAATLLATVLVCSGAEYVTRRVHQPRPLQPSVPPSTLPVATLVDLSAPTRELTAQTIPWPDSVDNTSSGELVGAAS